MSKWLDYKPGDYEKKWYDIKTMAGHTYYKCYPNAGRFRISEDETIDEHFVVKARISKIDPFGFEQDQQPSGGAPM